MKTEEDRWVQPPAAAAAAARGEEEDDGRAGVGGDGGSGGSGEGSKDGESGEGKKDDAAAGKTTCVWHLFVVRVGGGHRDALIKHLHAAGIGAGIHYPIPISQLGAYKELEPMSEHLPNATKDAAALLSLPLFPEMTDAQQDRVMAVCRAFYEEKE